jgi:uncharacterized membrane protein
MVEIRIRTAAVNLALYVIVTSVALFLWLTRHRRDYGAAQTGAFLGVCLAVVVIPVLYAVALFFRNALKTQDYGLAAKEARTFLKKYAAALLGAPSIGPGRSKRGRS